MTSETNRHPAECRFCRATDNVTVNVLQHGLAQKAEKCFFLSIDRTDRLPKLICKRCEASLCSAYAFGEKARLVEKELKRKYGTGEEDDFMEVEYLQDDAPFEYTTYESDPVGLALEKLKDTPIAVRKVPSKEAVLKDAGIHLEEDMSKKHRHQDEETVINLSGPVPCICMCCSTNFATMEELLKHKGKCDEESYICRRCCKVCDSQEALKKHQQTHYNYKHMYKCPSCERIFRNTFALDNHRSKDHGEDIEERGYVYRCCDKEFHTRKELHEHAKIHVEPPVECAVCGIKSKNKHTLRLHLKIHKDYRPHVCQKCGMAFKKHVELFQHNLVHKGVQLLGCFLCPKQFGNKISLKCHYQRCHPREAKQAHDELGVTRRKAIAQDHSYEGDVGREEEVETLPQTNVLPVAASH